MGLVPLESPMSPLLVSALVFSRYSLFSCRFLPNVLEFFLKNTKFGYSGSRIPKFWRVGMGISISYDRKIKISLICLQEQLELSIKAALPKFELQSPKNKIIRFHQRYPASEPSIKSLTLVSGANPRFWGRLGCMEWNTFIMLGSSSYSDWSCLRLYFAHTFRRKFQY